MVLQEEGYILVVGGSGFIGRAVCQQLAEQSAKVINASLVAIEATDYISIQSDVSNKSQLALIFEDHQIDCVVNLASLLRSASSRNPRQALRVGVLGTLNLLELCLDFGVARCIYASSTCLYQPSTEKQPADETAPVFTPTAYEVVKNICESMGRSISSSQELEFISARISLVVGPGKPSTTSAYRTDMFNLLLAGGEIYFPYRADQVLPLSHVEDVASALIKLILTHPLEHDVYNIPCEAWLLSNLAQQIETIAENARVTFGQQVLTDGASYINWDRIKNELAAGLTPLDEHLREYKQYLQKRKENQ